MTQQHDQDTEARVLVACIEEPHVLEQLDELEVDDFFDYRNQSAFTELRNLQALKEPISVIAIDKRLRANDSVREQIVADKAGVVYLANLLATTRPYDQDLEAARVDAKCLRLLRDERAAAVITGGEPPEPREQPASAHDWLNMPARVVNELEVRKKNAAHALNYHNTFLDDVLRVILPHDLILIGAETGLGKTDLALSVAMANAMAERRVAFFALEAEPNELEMRSKYSWLSREAHRRQLPDRHELNFTDWLIVRCEHIVGPLNAECDRWFLNNLGGFWTYYRGERFNQHDLRREILRIHKLVDIIVVDHLHYVDIEEGDSEGEGIGETMKAIRDVSLRIGKPVILVAHLRKKDERMKKIVPSLGDFHGSSNISKVCTQAITIARARKVQAPKWWLAPTYVSVIKDRRAGAPPYVALQFFDRRSRSYEDDYVLGQLVKGDTDWEPVKPGDQPSWARGHRQLELEFV
jgi:replicative DNA helicase